MRLLATALMLNGIAMAICGSSRPASGSEHLISHALDQVSQHPKRHGLQVGLAAYVVSRLQEENSELISQVLDTTGFWRGIEQDPFSRSEWLRAVEQAPAIKPDRYTILSSRPCRAEVESMLDQDERLRRCFVD
jgi:glycerol-1-phosphate dehydrogenase [NAD(P)+]